MVPAKSDWYGARVCPGTPPELEPPRPRCLRHRFCHLPWRSSQLRNHSNLADRLGTADAPRRCGRGRRQRRRRGIANLAAPKVLPRAHAGARDRPARTFWRGVCISSRFRNSGISRCDRNSGGYRTAARAGLAARSRERQCIGAQGARDDAGNLAVFRRGV